jgi:hypothetical protein
MGVHQRGRQEERGCTILNAMAAAKKSRPISPDHPIPFGKHKGIPIDEVPGDYLVWALKNMDCCDPDHEKFWPEFTATLESLVGPQDRGTPAPRTLSLGQLCERLRELKITVWLENNKLVTSRTPEPEIKDAIKAHASAFAAVLGCAAGNSNVGLTRSAFIEDVRKLVKSWYRSLSQKFHPDVGGTEEAQKAANECYASFQELLNEWEKYKP